MRINFDLESDQNNIRQVLKEWEVKKQKMLYAMGLKWQELATKVISSKIYVGEKPWKLTGRLRASLSFITPTQSGPRSRVSASDDDNYVDGKSEKDTLTIGTNVIYARKVNDKHKYMQESVLPYAESYKNVAETIFKE